MNGKPNNLAPLDGVTVRRVLCQLVKENKKQLKFNDVQLKRNDEMIRSNAEIFKLVDTLTRSVIVIQKENIDIKEEIRVIPDLKSRVTRLEDKILEKKERGGVRKWWASYITPTLIALLGLTFALLGWLKSCGILR